MFSIFVLLFSLIGLSVARPALLQAAKVKTTLTVSVTTRGPTAGGALRKLTTTTSSLRTSTTAAVTQALTTLTTTATYIAPTTATSPLTSLVSTVTTPTTPNPAGTTPANTGYASSTTFLFTGTALPSGLSASTWLVNTSPLAHQFDPSNAYVSGGYLNLVVPGGQSSAAGTIIQAGEVSTTFTVASANVQTFAILTNVAGVCNGAFYYDNVTQEADIEWLSSAQSNANVQTKETYRRAMFYTDQPTTVGEAGTQIWGPPPQNPTTTVHNYQMIWDSNESTNFYVDGVHQYTLTSNVPSATTGRWFWNNWSSGDPYWSAGPPATEAIYKIQKIIMYYNPGS